jgi:hypothetical protein
MSTPTHADTGIFTDVINSMMKELHTLPHSLNTILSLITHSANLDSPVLPEIHHLSLSKLDTNQLASLLPALSKMTGLTSLALPRCKPSPDHLKFLFTECPALSNLQSLDLSHVNELKSEDLHLLSQSTTLTNLTSLNFEWSSVNQPRTPPFVPLRGDGFDTFGCFAAGQKPVRDFSGLISLLSSPVVKNLTHLNLCNTDVNDPSFVHITVATSPHLSNLVSLDLSGINIDQEAVSAFVESATLVNLTHLNLSYNSMGDLLIMQLFSPISPLPKKLQSLHLREAELTIASLELLQKTAPYLTELNIAGNYELGSDGVAFIAAHMPNLTKLDLGYCDIGDEGYTALATSTALTNLRELTLRGNDALATEPIIALINSPVLTKVTHLNLSDISSGTAVLTAIAKSLVLGNLARLDLSQNYVSDGFIALAQSTTLTNLTWLDLSANILRPDAVEALCTSPVVSKLTFLRLTHHLQLGRSFAEILAAPSSTLYNLVELRFDSSHFDDASLLKLLKTPNLDQLLSLQLGTHTSLTSATQAVYRARFDDHLATVYVSQY